MVGFSIGLGLVWSPACNRNQPASGRAQDHLIYWCATNPQEYELAKLWVAQWNQSSGMKVELQPIPAGNSSEEVILAAIAGKTTPDIYSNHWTGMTEELRLSGNLICLDDLPGAKLDIRNRCGDAILDQFVSPDGKLYQVPWKVNPIMIMINRDRFRNRGVQEDLTTYSRFIQAGAKLTYDENQDGYDDHWFGYRNTQPLWFQRWFDFYTFYLAASGGRTFFNATGKFEMDSMAAVSVFTLFRDLYLNGYYPKTNFQGQPFIISRVIATEITGSWNISTINHFKADDLDYGFLPIPLPDNSPYQDHYTYGDYKNFVIYSTCRVPQQAWEFIKFVTNKENDIRLLEITRQIPARQGLLQDSLMLDFFTRYPELMPFARQAQFTRSINSLPEIKEIFDAISQQWEICCIYQRKTPEEAVHDAGRRIRQIINQAANP